MTTTDGLLHALERELTALESTLMDTLRVMQKPSPALVAALAAVHERLPALPTGPAAQLLRLRALTLDAAIAWSGSWDAQTAVTGFDTAVPLLCELIDEGGAVAAEAADRAVEVCTDTAMIFLALGDLAAAEVRLRRADTICETCDVGLVLRLDLMSVWTFVDFGYARFAQALQRAEAAVALSRDVGGESMVAAVHNLAQACRHLGDWERAAALYEQVLASPSRTQAQDQSARLGLAVSTALIDPERGVPLLLDVVDRSQHDQGGEILAHAAATLGSIAQADGRLDEARSWYTMTVGATVSPPIVAGGYTLLARASDDPATAAQLRREARRVAGEESVELQVWFDFITSRDALAGGATAPETTLALTAALVIDVWRIDLPPNLRQSWQRIDQSNGTGPILRHTQDLGRHDLVAGLAAHLCAIVPPDRHDPRPPRVLVAGADPLGKIAAAAVERYDRPIRDDQRTIDAYQNSDGLDLVAVQRDDVYLCWRRPTGVMHSVRIPRDRLDTGLAELEQASGAALAPSGESALLRWSTEVDLMRRLGLGLLPPRLVSDLTHLPAPRLRVRADGDLATVPWGLLVVPGLTGDSACDTRLVELVDVVTLAPFGLPVRTRPSTEATTDRLTHHGDDRPVTLDGADRPVTLDGADRPVTLDGADRRVTLDGADRRVTLDGADGVVAVLDPRVPGFPADSALGSVLGRQPAGGALERRMRTYLEAGRLVGRPVPEPGRSADGGDVGRATDSPGGPVVADHQHPADAAPVGEHRRAGPLVGLFRRRDQDRAWLADALSTRPARLLYLGHASDVVLTDGVTTEPALHLCCSADVPGRAAPLGAHRPLTASDVLADDCRWPARVALIACASGDDARTRDAYGLAHAVLCQGADLATGLLWPLPTGRWYHELVRPPETTSHTETHHDVGDGPADENPVVALTLAVDQAHESPDPVRAICQWQRDRLRRWRTSQSLLDSPIGWGGLHTIVPADG